MPITDPETIRRMVASVDHWYHQIELAPGIVTPGAQDSAGALKILDTLGLPQDCSKLRALDIGARDGFFSFELERRGAHVLALDYISPKKTGFAVASEILGSRVDFALDNVYNLRPETYGHFGIILFLGVIYHLRNPMLALDCIRSVSRLGKQVFVESHLTQNETLLASDVPAWEFHPRDTIENTTKWGPNMAGLSAMVKEARYQIDAEYSDGKRGWLLAQAVEDKKLEYYRRLDSGIESRLS